MAKDLEAAGLERRQAEGITNAVSDAVADLATKDDLRTEMALLGSRLTNRVYGAAAVAVGVIVGALAIATAIVLRATG